MKAPLRADASARRRSLDMHTRPCHTERNVMSEICPKCEGMGIPVIRRADGSQAAETCECQHVQRVSRLLTRAAIPRRYELCCLDSFEWNFPGGGPLLHPA